MKAPSSAPQGFGYMAFCYGEGKLLPVQVIETLTGSYIGTVGEDGVPFSRESEETYETADEARSALENHTWTPILFT